jgi:hypothetical protein
MKEDSMPIRIISGASMVLGCRRFQLMQVLVVQTATVQKALVAVPIAIMMRLILHTVNL